jgi:hypothetical protein
LVGWLQAAVRLRFWDLRAKASPLFTSLLIKVRFLR